MRSTFSVHMTFAFVIGEEEITKLVTLFQDRIGKVEITIDCADDVSRELNSIRSIISYENPKAKEIRRLRIVTWSEDRAKSAEILLSGLKWRTVSVEVSGRDDVVDRLRTASLDIIMGTRAWYSVVHSDAATMAASILIVAIFGGVSMAFLLRGQQTNLASGMVMSSGVLFIPTLLLVRYLRNRFFPFAIFLIGQGKTRYRTLERVQWVAVSIIATLVLGAPFAIFKMLAP